MKKITLIILMCLVCSAALADDYADSLTEISRIVRQNLNVWGASAKLPDSVVFNSIREGFITLAPILYARTLTDTIYTSANEFQYAVDSQFLMIDMVFYKDTNNVISISLINADSFNTVFAFPKTLTLGDGNQSIPNYCNWRGGYLRFYPVPIKVDTFIISGYAKVQSIMSDTTFVSDFPVTYRPAVIAYATSHAALRMGNPAWADWFKLYESLKADILMSIGRGSNDK